MSNVYFGISLNSHKCILICKTTKSELKIVFPINIAYNMKYIRIYHAFEPPHDKTNKMACASSEGSDQPGHPPILIRVFAVRVKKAWALSYPLSAQRRLCSDWADAQADLSLRWAHTHFVGFVMRRLMCFFVFLKYIYKKFIEI